MKSASIVNHDFFQLYFNYLSRNENFNLKV